MSNIIEAFNEAKVHNISLHTQAVVRKAIAENVNQSNATSYRWWTASKAWLVRTRADTKRIGRELSVAKASVKGLDNHDCVVTGKESKAVMAYMRTLSDTSGQLVAKVEPMYAQRVSNFRGDLPVWQAVDVVALHPYRCNTFEDDATRDTVWTQYVHLEQIHQSIQRLHAIHQSTVDARQIAYYPTLKHMRAQREVRTTLGKYLTKYAEVFRLDERTIKSMAEKYNAIVSARVGWEVAFKEHDDPQGWIDVYSDEIQSCMRGESAVRVYAHELSVLRLAYVKSGNNAVARCIVRDDDRKGYLRVYPDPNGHPEGRFLLDSLKTLGYGNEIDLDGVLIQAIEHGSAYVCPYIDSGYNGTQSVDTVRRSGKTYLLVGEGSYSASNTSGLTNPSCSCDRCGDAVDEDDTSYVECDEVRVCQDCLDNNYTYAYGRLRHGEDYYREEDCIQANNGNNYVTEYAHEHDIYECDVDGDWYSLDDMYSFEEGYVYVNNAIDLDHKHISSDLDAAHPDYVTTLSDGTVCHSDDEEHYQSEIDELDEDESESERVTVAEPRTGKSVGALVRIIKDDKPYAKAGDTGRILKIDPDKTCYIDFNKQGNDEVYGDGCWWIMLNNTAVI